MQALTVHGQRRSFGNTYKPIYDLTELREAVRLRNTVMLNNQTLFNVYKLEQEDGSGRIWNVYGLDDNKRVTFVCVYALQTAQS